MPGTPLVRVQLIEDVCVKPGKLYLIPPYLAFASLDRKSVRFTMPLCVIRRVERLNARAGIYALSLSLYNGMKIVGHPVFQCARSLVTLSCRSCS